MHLKNERASSYLCSVDEPTDFIAVKSCPGTFTTTPQGVESGLDLVLLERENHLHHYEKHNIRECINVCAPTCWLTFRTFALYSS